jgi:hypothetical protein
VPADRHAGTPLADKPGSIVVTSMLKGVILDHAGPDFADRGQLAAGERRRVAV